MPGSNSSSRERRPKVRIVCQLFYPELVSTGQTMTELAETLVDLGLDVGIISGPPTVIRPEAKVAKVMVHKGIKIRRVWGTRLPKLSLIGKAINQLTFFFSAFLCLLSDASKSPLLLTTNPPFLGMIGPFLDFLGGKRYIYLVFDVYPDTAEKLGVIRKRGIIARIWDFGNRLILRRASSVIVLGETMRRIILDKGKGLDSLARKTLIISLWSDDRKIQPVEKTKNRLLTEWELKGKFVISYSGNMGRFHDMETLMGAARELRSYEEIVFLFIGEGQQKSWMKKYAQEWRLNNCRFHAYVRREELSLSLACADVGLVTLLPSQEGLSEPSKTLGIMAAGVPVIGVLPSGSEMARILIENSCGKVVEPGDVKGLAAAILTLYHHPELRLAWGQNARRSVKDTYSLVHAARSYVSVIKSLQDGRSENELDES